MDTDRSERIRQRAYEIWRAEGNPEGCELRHWLMAESEIDECGAPEGTFKEVSFLGENNDNAPSGERAGLSEDVGITTGKEPPRKKIKRTEGP